MGEAGPDGGGSLAERGTDCMQANKQLSIHTGTRER